MSCKYDNHTNFSYLALGDSYTIGEGIDEKNRYPIIIVRELQKQGINFNNPRIIAKTGWTTDELNDSLNLSVFNTKYDYVSLLVGVNNQYRGLSSYIFEKEFRQLLSRSINYSKNKSNVFVLSIPDWGVTPFAGKRNKIAISDSIDVFNQLIKKVCFENNIKFFDITDISREAELNSDLIAGDSLHPSGIMYKKWIDKILNEWKI